MRPDAPLTTSDLCSILADVLEGAAERLRSRAIESADQRTPEPQKNEPPLFALPPGEKLTLTFTEAAERLGIGRSSAYEAVRTGAIPSLRVGRRLLIPRLALHQTLNELAR